MSLNPPRPGEQPPRAEHPLAGLIAAAAAGRFPDRHRHKKTDTELPRQFGYNMPLELVLTVSHS